MTREDLKKYKVFLESLSHLDKTRRNLYLRDLALGKRQGPMTGYPSIDKPWLKNFSFEAITGEISLKNTTELLYDNNKDNLEQTAITYEKTKICTYGELFKKVDKIASALISMGIRKGDIVSMCIPNIPEIAYLFLALNKIGAISDFIDPRAAANVMEEHLNLANSKTLFTISGCYPIFNEIRNKTKIEKIISVHPLESLIEKKVLNKEQAEQIEKSPTLNQLDGEWHEFVLRGDSKSSIDYQEDVFLPSTILHTGGSTGVPKGAVLSNYNLNALIYQWTTSGIKYERGKKLLSLMPPFVSFGLAANLCVPLYQGMEIIMISKYEPEKIIDVIKEYEPNVIPGSPAHYEYIDLDPRSKEMNWTTLDAALMGGDNINPEVEARLNELFPNKFISAYGATETATAIAMAYNENVNYDGTVGTPLVKTNIEIRDIYTKEELQYNQVGEIQVTTPNLMMEYYRMDDETDKAIKIHYGKERYFHTGDIGSIDENGILTIKDRIKRLIIQFDGTKVYPKEVEAIISKYPEVKKVAIASAKDSEHLHGHIPIAFVVPKNNISFDMNALNRYCEENIIDYCVPKDYVLINDLPYTKNNGKVDYLKLSELYKEEILKKSLKKVG